MFFVSLAFRPWVSRMLGAVADPYEREQMPGVGEVLFRQKVTSPRWLMGWMVALPLGLGTLVALGLGVGGLFGGAGFYWGAAAAFAGGIAMAVFFAALNLMFASARVAVSEGELHIQLGMAGPQIPISRIASVALAPSGINRIGMGVGTDLQGTTYYRMWGDNAEAVHLTMHGDKKIVVVLKDARAMKAAIEEALRRRDA